VADLEPIFINLLTVYLHMKIKDVILGIAIIILTILVAIYGINTIFPKPAYEDYCNSSYITTKPYQDRTVCPQVCIPAYEIVRSQCVYNACGSGCGPDEVNTFANQTSCEKALYDFQCYERYDAVVKERSKKVFFVALPLGIAVLALGAFFFGLEAVGAGLIDGVIGTLIYGAGAYWPYTQNWLRFILSLVGLVLLIWLAYFWNKMRKKRKKRR